MYQILDNIDNINDRSILVLLDSVRERNKKERREYERLSNIWIRGRFFDYAIKQNTNKIIPRIICQKRKRLLYLGLKRRRFPIYIKNRLNYISFLS